MPEVAARPPEVPNYGIDSDRHLGRDAMPDALRRRWAGHYAVDEFGGDPHLQDFLVAPVVGRIPVTVRGGEHVPRHGGALLLANRVTGWATPFVLSGTVQRETGRRLRLAGVPAVPLLSTLTHKLGALGWRGSDVAAVVRAGHLVAAPLTRSFGAGDAPNRIVAATLGAPVVPVAIRAGGPGGLPIRPWVVSIGSPLAPPASTAPGDPLAAAELAEAVRAAVAMLLTH